ncbi:MAG: TIGR00730 family Rossman fold protein [Pseudonocardia sp.]
MRSVRSVCVFCGSNPGRVPAYLDAVGELAGLLAARGVRIVYGGNSVGTMGALADTALAAGGEVVGVVPEQLAGVELLHEGLSELHLVGSMHERKALMGELADGFVALPGGLGTLEELAEVLTWSQIGLHRKPVGLLNTAGYYDHLLAFLDHAVAERFLRTDDRALVLTAATPAVLLDVMQGWRPRADQAWAPAEG